jgi:cellulose 1,4-beta-cellobiosidase
MKKRTKQRLLQACALAVLLLAGRSSTRAQNLAGYSVLNTSPVTATSFADSACADSQRCFYYVTAVNAIGESGPSNIVNVTIPATGTHTVTVSWSASTGATSYNVYKGTAPLPPVATVTSN